MALKEESTNCNDKSLLLPINGRRKRDEILDKIYK